MPIDPILDSALQEEIRSLQQQNRMLRRSMWHHVRLGGGVTVIKHNDFINFYEVDEVLHWHYDEGLHATVYKSVDSAGRLIAGEFRAPQFVENRSPGQFQLLWSDIKYSAMTIWETSKEAWSVWRGK